MKYIDLYEQFVPKLNDEPVEVSSIGSFGQRITNKGTNKIRKQDVIVATNKTIKQIVKDEIDRLGKDADLNHIDTSQVTNMDNLFEDTDFQGDISQWDVSNVKDMFYMFADCTNFNCDISKWNVGKVKDMTSMFDDCHVFNQDLSGWKVDNVETMFGMFAGCEKFNSDISNWNVSKVENMSNMFWGCKKFKQDLSNWNVSKVEYIGDMFRACPIKKEYKPNFKHVEVYRII